MYKSHSGSLNHVGSCHYYPLSEQSSIDIELHHCIDLLHLILPKQYQRYRM